MRQTFRWLNFVAIFIAGVTVGLLLPPARWADVAAPPAPPQHEEVALESPVIPPDIQPSPEPPDDALPVVTRVIDGDTVELQDGRKVRYIGIDAPEINKHDCFATEAKMENARLVLNRSVRLERDVTNTDRFGRLLRYVYVGDTFVNLALIADGFAQVLTYPPDVRFNEQFRTATAEARTAKRGQWGGCQDSEPSPSPATTKTPSTGCVIKGNINTKGEKIYHLPGCGSYEKTVIEETKGERWFCAETDAAAAGFRKAGNCP